MSPILDPEVWPPPQDGKTTSRYGKCDTGRCLHSGLIHTKWPKGGLCLIPSCPCSRLRRRVRLAGKE